MWGTLKFILLTIVLAVIIFGTFSLLSRFVFNKIRVNKWILLVASIIFFFLPIVLKFGGVWQIVCTALFVILFLWFMDVHRNGNPKLKKDNKKVVIKPKAKPNRVKNMQKKDDK